MRIIQHLSDVYPQRIKQIVIDIYLRFALIAAADEETASFMAVISSAILLNESVRADVSVESLMVLSFILKLLKIIKCVSCGEL